MPKRLRIIETSGLAHYDDNPFSPRSVNESHFASFPCSWHVYKRLCCVRPLHKTRTKQRTLLADQFQRAYQRFLRRYIQVRVVETYLSKERLETQKRYCSAWKATVGHRLKLNSHCGDCGKGNCPICAMSYASAIRTANGYEWIQCDRKMAAVRRFHEFVDGNGKDFEAKSSQEARISSLFKQVGQKQAHCTTLATVCELGTLP
jgi:hypothetical protein